MQQWAVETRALTKDFDGERAVDHLDLTVPAGSVFGLMGPNGAGKSTVIKMLMGIIKPTAGTGVVLGKEITDPSGAFKHHVGYIADSPHMYPFFRVAEILEFCAQVYPHWDWRKCGTLLRIFELPTGKWVQMLSEGMKTQLAMIIALSMRPQVLILDEPATSLDPLLKHHFMQLIMQEVASGNTTVFFSTNNPHDLERMADQVAIMLKGKLLFNRPMDELKATTRKIQAVFPAGLPEQIKAIPGILRVEARGKVYSIIAGDRFVEILERVKALNPVYIEALDISLEELFIHTIGKEGYGYEAVFAE